MNPALSAVRIGLGRGWTEFRHILAMGQEYVFRVSAQIVGIGSAVLIAISGIFYPISGLPSWLHPVAELFPFYWLGLGMRSALLPYWRAASRAPPIG